MVMVMMVKTRMKMMLILMMTKIVMALKSLLEDKERQDKEIDIFEQPQLSGLVWEL